MGRRILVLGPDQGWHATQLRNAALARGDHIEWSTYESLVAGVGMGLSVDERARRTDTHTDVRLRDYDLILARTMPLGSLEQITFRLSVLHTLAESGIQVINHPQTMEIAIDKYRTLARVAKLGVAIPRTIVTQSRAVAMEAFEELGRDVVVKPIFGGEGRGVMRLQDRELAWTTFTTLEQLQAVIYVQAFVRPGGIDTRLLVIGDQIFAIRRYAEKSWKTNVAQGGRCERIVPTAELLKLGQHIAADLRLVFGAIDVLDCESGCAKVVEVNAVPGWKGAESALKIDVASMLLATI